MLEITHINSPESPEVQFPITTHHSLLEAYEAAESQIEIIIAGHPNHHKSSQPFFAQIRKNHDQLHALRHTLNNNMLDLLITLSQQPKQSFKIRLKTKFETRTFRNIFKILSFL